MVHINSCIDHNFSITMNFNVYEVPLEMMSVGTEEKVMNLLSIFQGLDKNLTKI